MQQLLLSCFQNLWKKVQKTAINFSLLQEAIKQINPWRGENIEVNAEWFLKKMEEKIMTVDWEVAKKDIARVLRSHELPALDVWSKEFFLSRVNKMNDYLS